MSSSGGVETKQKTVKDLSIPTTSLLPRTGSSVAGGWAQASQPGLTVARTRKGLEPQPGLAVMSRDWY